MTISIRAMAFSLAVAGMASAVSGADSDDMAARFGALESARQISMSPSGNRIAIVSPVGSGSGVSVIDLASGKPPIRVLHENDSDQDISNCSWPTDDRLICRVFIQGTDREGYKYTFSRMMVFDHDGGHAKVLTDTGGIRSLGFTWSGGGVIDWNGGKPGTILMQREYVPESTAGTRIASKLEGVGVERVDVNSLGRVNVERPRTDSSQLISDGRGHVRIMGASKHDNFGYQQGKVEFYYRKPDDDSEWLELSTVTDAADGSWTGFNPVSVDPDQNVVYGFDDNEAGRRAVYSVKLDGTRQRKLILGRDDADIDHLISIGRSERVIGASYATDKRFAEYFDPELGKLASALVKALPGFAQIDWVDASEDENKLVLLASSDVKPGTFYLFDKTTHRLDEVMPLRPQLADVPLATMKPVTFSASDGTQIPGYLTLPVGSDGKNLPAIVMPHGGPSSRDEWGFDWLVQFFAARGYAVLQPNYRGSSGYGADWYKKNGFQSWRTAIGDIDDAGRWLVSEGIAQPDKLAIVGWSYGGYAALQSGVTEPGLYKAIVAVAPVTDLEELREESKHYADEKLTSAFIGEGPHIEAGSPARHADKITVPVLLFHGEEDRNVDVEESRLMDKRLKEAGKSVEYIEFPELAHSLVSADARTTLLSKSDAFLRKTLGIR